MLLYNLQVVDAQTERIKQVAHESGVPTVGVSEAMPAGATFQSWQLQEGVGGLRPGWALDDQDHIVEAQWPELKLGRRTRTTLPPRARCARLRLRTKCRSSG